MTDVVLHIGLHKTATRFLQRALFRNLDPHRFLYNPTDLSRKLRRALRSHAPDDIQALRAAASSARQQAGMRTLLLSDPGIAGDMYSSYADWRVNRDLLAELFPGARVIYFVRKPTDWLHSAYRQALAKGPGIPITFFLNFRDGAFRPRAGRFIGDARNLNALALPFRDIYLGYCNSFGSERVYLFRQEHLRQRPGAVYASLAQALGIEALPELPQRVSGNRAMSALAIHLFFPGIHRQPAGAASDLAPPRRALRLRRWLRRWRTVFIQHVFDRMLYRDWDLLARNGMRDDLEQYYATVDARLMDAAARILDDGPGASATAVAAATGSTQCSK